ncbi:palmitoyltransferase ZDHHC11 isoform X2 [Poeciliopsis prolifica]|uniref:palmitoyltransferase ZDHHC11 isoform X2 n=1 Tax=Poeciliopsis prolifica TaxID=188132 RepID=UPI00241308D2|nr:palmitoyltransferase ZDHHC11 isoform X2 [Poeciliopsis prolifica]
MTVYCGFPVKKMNCFSRRFRRTAPTRGSSKSELVPSRTPRINGWSWPLQPLQVVGWVLYIYLAVVSFGIFIPLLPQPWNAMGYAISGISFLLHFFTNIATVTIDPADSTVRAKKNYSSPLPLFDKAKQAHVIQDLHCYLCDVKVGPRVKHCGICNKCVEGFDHHCKWLNTCVGQRNYWFFFVALISAILAVFLLTVVVLFIFVQHYLDPRILRTAPQFGMLGNTTWLVFLPISPIKTSSAGLLTLAFVTVLLCIVCMLLFCHLLGLHLYLFYKGISTYDHVKNKREKEDRRRNTESKSASSCSSKSNTCSQENQEASNNRVQTLPQSSSFFRFANTNQLSSRLSNSICTELENFKKSAEKENSFNYGTENPTQNETRSISMSVIMSPKPDKHEEDQGTSEKSTPEAQDPLGCSVVAWDPTSQ